MNRAPTTDYLLTGFPACAGNDDCAGFPAFHLRQGCGGQVAGNDGCAGFPAGVYPGLDPGSE